MAKKSKPTKEPQAAYNQEFRETAIKLALQGDKPIVQVARELGLPEKRLYSWVAAWKKKEGKNSGGDSGSGSKSTGATNAELRKLQKRNRELEQEVEILKKAAAYFAKTLL
jgi:transposase-like protein